MIFKLKISKKVLVRMAVLMILAGAAYFLDIYLEDHPVKIEVSKETSSNETNGNLIFYNTVNNVNANQNIQRAPFRFLHMRLHDRFLQKHYEQRIFHALKDELVIQKVPLVLSYHFLVFRGYCSSLPDDEPTFS